MIPTMIFFLVVGLTTIVSGAGLPQATIERQNALRKTVADSSNKFSFKLYTKLKSSNEGSFVYSPFSVHMLLAMVTYGTAGTTKSQLQTALELSRQDGEAQDGFGLIVRDMNSYERVDLMVKNKIFASTSLRIKHRYDRLTGFSFMAPTGKVDFNRIDQAVKNINEWCATNTRGLIEEIVSSDDLDENTKLVLANVVYFKGDWKTRFDEIFNSTFNLRDKETVKVEMMEVLADFNYGNILNGAAEFVELPYQSNDPEYGVSMFIILPAEKHTIGEVEEQITQITIDNLIAAGSPQKIKVWLPKFRIESDIQLNDHLKKLGITDMFVDGVANFSEITGSEGFAVKTVKQKAVVEVSQTGTIAAAASAADARWRINNGVMTFFANRPFIAIIATTGKNRVNLFTARYNGQ